VPGNPGHRRARPRYAVIAPIYGGPLKNRAR